MAQCAECGFNIDKIEGALCPECGFKKGTSSAEVITKRFKRLAAINVVVLILASAVYLISTSLFYDLALHFVSVPLCTLVGACVGLTASVMGWGWCKTLHGPHRVFRRTAITAVSLSPIPGLLVGVLTLT